MEHCFEKALAEQCAPTLAGVKPASLFRVGGEITSLRRIAKFWDCQLAPQGIRVLILKECAAAGACMVYIYRKAWLDRILSDPENLAFLQSAGYQETETTGFLQELSNRFCLEREYPHEIGVFLGYPLEDVIGFIENHGRNYTCCGHWKCYGDPTAAQACFARYRACTSAYKRMYELGIPVMRLVVAA